MWGRLEREKNVRVEQAVACSFQRCCQRLVHFPNKQTSLAVLLAEYAPLFLPPALNIFNPWVINYRLASRRVATCHPTSRCQKRGVLLFLRKAEKRRGCGDCKRLLSPPVRGCVDEIGQMKHGEVAQEEMYV